NSSRMALSMKIEMRVLPFCTTTAPRLPFEKSYSGFIAFPFPPGRAARREQAAGFLALGPDDHEQLDRAPQPQRHEAPLGARLPHRDRERVLERPARVRQRHPVPLQVGGRLRRVVADGHGRMIYILYAYGKRRFNRSGCTACSASW